MKNIKQIILMCVPVEGFTYGSHGMPFPGNFGKFIKVPCSDCQQMAWIGPRGQKVCLETEAIVMCAICGHFNGMINDETPIHPLGD